MSECGASGLVGVEQEVPTEEERLAWEERQQQRDNLSGLMGQYMLKGYRMLGTNCRDCGNILLRTRDGTDYCVFCTEIQGRPMVDETEQEHNPFPPDNDISLSSQQNTSLQNITDSNVTTHALSTDPAPSPPLTHHQPFSLQDVVSCSREAVVSKLRWASNELTATSSVEHSTQLCQLITACAHALDSMKNL